MRQLFCRIRACGCFGKDDGAGTVVVTVPARAEAGRQIHLVVEGTDTGSPALTRYQRVVLTVV